MTPSGELRTISNSDLFHAFNRLCDVDDKSVATYFGYANQILEEHSVPPLPVDTIGQIVQSAFAVQTLFFGACLRHPTRAEQYQVFEAFVSSCVTPQKRNQP
jgi:hypothetical protein